MKILKGVIGLLVLIAIYTPAFPVEVAPRISDREIVERLTRLEEGQAALNKRMEEGFAALNQRIDDLNKRIDDLNQRIDDQGISLRAEMNARFEAIDKRLDMLTWMIGLFITIAMVIMGFLFQMQRQLAHRQTQVEKVLEAHETSLETQKDEINFLKGLVEKLLSPKGIS